MDELLGDFMDGLYLTSDVLARFVGRSAQVLSHRGNALPIRGKITAVELLSGGKELVIHLSECERKSASLEWEANPDGYSLFVPLSLLTGRCGYAGMKPVISGAEGYVVIEDWAREAH